MEAGVVLVVRRRGLGFELVLRAHYHAGDFFQPPRSAVLIDIG